MDERENSVRASEQSQAVDFDSNVDGNEPVSIQDDSSSPIDMQKSINSESP